MKVELLSVIGLLLCLIIIGIEYIIHYRLAERQDEHSIRERDMTWRMNLRVDAVLRAPTRACLQSEIRALNEDIGEDPYGTCCSYNDTEDARKALAQTKKQLDAANAQLASLKEENRNYRNLMNSRFVKLALRLRSICRKLLGRDK